MDAVIPEECVPPAAALANVIRNNLDERFGLMPRQNECQVTSIDGMRITWGKYVPSMGYGQNKLSTLYLPA
jgi:hypothetical protein